MEPKLRADQKCQLFVKYFSNREGQVKEFLSQCPNLYIAKQKTGVIKREKLKDEAVQ